MNLKESVTPITLLKNRTAQLVDDVAQGRTLVITQNGRARAVMMDVTTYDQWRRALALLKIVSLGEGDVAAGRTMSSDEAFMRAAAAIERSAADE